MLLALLGNCTLAFADPIWPVFSYFNHCNWWPDSIGVGSDLLIYQMPDNTAQPERYQDRRSLGHLSVYNFVEAEPRITYFRAILCRAIFSSDLYGDGAKNWVRSSVKKSQMNVTNSVLKSDENNIQHGLIFRELAEPIWIPSFEGQQDLLKFWSNDIFKIRNPIIQVADALHGSLGDFSNIEILGAVRFWGQVS